jgi:hypothetical protein
MYLYLTTTPSCYSITTASTFIMAHSWTLAWHLLVQIIQWINFNILDSTSSKFIRSLFSCYVKSTISSAQANTQFHRRVQKHTSRYDNIRNHQFLLRHKHHNSSFNHYAHKYATLDAYVFQYVKNTTLSCSKSCITKQKSRPWQNNRQKGISQRIKFCTKCLDKPSNERKLHTTSLLLVTLKWIVAPLIIMLGGC